IEVGHLPKYERGEKFEFLLVRYYSKSDSYYQNIVREFSNKIAILFNESKILTIHQHDIPFLSAIKAQIQQQNPTNLTYKNIMYLLLSYTFQTYEMPFKDMSEELDKLENQLFLSRNPKFDQKNIYLLKREANSCKKILTITRDVLDEYLSFHKKTSLYSRCI